jgi:lipopolysaccharide heptosyltransferase I
MNILLVRLGALGDVVHAIPVAAALRRRFPSARIDWLVSGKHRPLLDLVPVIDRRLVLDEATTRGVRLFTALRELRRSQYDVAIDLQGLLKSAFLARSSGAHRVLGFATTYLRERAARLFYTDAYDPGCRGLYDPREMRHVVEINLGLLEPLGIGQSPPEFPIDPIESAVAADVARRTAGRYAILNPGAQWPNKRWPADRLGRVAAVLRMRFGLTSVALWGSGERHLADEIVAHAEGAAFASPKASIADLVALARGATVMVSGDTGPVHIASAVGTPIVGLFGPTRPSRNGPLSAHDVIVSRAGVCQCHHLRTCRAGRMCLLDVEVEEVVAAVARRLATEPACLTGGP